MNYELKKVKTVRDQRGILVEFLRGSELEVKTFGQNYFVTFKEKGVSRGNHYHKNRSEWFSIITGKLKVILIDVKTKEKKEFIFSESNGNISRLRIGPDIAHVFINLSEFSAMINYTDNEYMHNLPDKYQYIIYGK